MEIDQPSLKDKLWHSFRRDLARYQPEAEKADTLMCPMCGRYGTLDDFSVEHVIPQQALNEDPEDVRSAISRNERAVTTLLCRRRIWRGARLWNNGCNGWKGRYFDTALRSIFNGKIVQGDVTTRHQVAFLSACYLGLFATYGYQVALTESGVLCRQQFFSPGNFLDAMPLKSQMLLLGQPQTAFNEETKVYWSPPFRFEIQDFTCLVSARNAVMYIPLSRNPELPVSRVLPYVPPRHRFKADFRPIIVG